MADRNPIYVTGESPTQQVLAAITAHPDDSGSSRGIIVKTINVPASGGSLLRWRNPEPRRLMAKAGYFFTTAGAGTVDLGIGTFTDTSANDFIDGGTMDNANPAFRNNASSTLGGLLEWQAMGASGTADDTIVFSHNSAATGTGVGQVIIMYVTLG